jgi:GNAT superfamily N-acetyltransferase
MRDATGFGTQWAGLVALVRLLGEHAPEARLIERDGVIGSVLPASPSSSILNSALAVDPARTPTQLAAFAAAFERAGVQKWGLWVDGGDERAAAAATAQGMVLDSRPAPMVAPLADLPFDEAPERQEPDRATVGRVNDLAYGHAQPRLAPVVAALPDSVLAYGGSDSVALAYDIVRDTAVWFVATTPDQQGKGLAKGIVGRLLLDARERGQATASLQASQAGRPLYERLGFRTVGTLHFYEQQLTQPA